MFEAVHDCGDCLVGPVDLLAGVCCCWLHCHLWIKFEVKSSEFFGFVEGQWVGGIMERESWCQPEE